MYKINFGLVLSDPKELDVATRISRRLAKIEREITGHHLAPSIGCDSSYTTEELNTLIYFPHSSHIDALVVVLVNDLGDVTKEIEKVEHPDIKLLLREWYYNIKDALCKNDTAQAYYFNR